MICHFNTSHVTVYHRQENDRSSSFRISIHLMLLFIRFRSDTSESYGYFNTSHVTVYLIWESWPDRRKQISIHLMLLFISAPGIQRSVHRKFQYISCYCLSYAVKYNTPVVITFQYISCYCLSFCSSRTALEYKDFNTSHVTVYLDDLLTGIYGDIFQYISCYCLSRL